MFLSVLINVCFMIFASFHTMLSKTMITSILQVGKLKLKILDQLMGPWLK